MSSKLQENINEMHDEQTTLGLDGKTIHKILYTEDKIIFIFTEFLAFICYYDESNRASVFIEDIIGDLQNLIGAPLLISEERTNINDRSDGRLEWTFYEFATNKGSVTIRWYGYSNGYYSTSVRFKQIDLTTELLADYIGPEHTCIS